MDRNDFVIIEEKNDSHIQSTSNANKSKSKVMKDSLFIYIVFAVFITTLILAITMLGRFGLGNNNISMSLGEEEANLQGEEETIFETEIVTPEPTPTPTPVPKAVSYSVDEKVTSIEELYNSSALEGTTYRDRMFYCSNITQYDVKEKTGCEMFLFWDTLEILIYHDNKLINLDLYEYDSRKKSIAYEEIPDIHVCDFDGDNQYELLLTIRTVDISEKPPHVVKFYHLDLNTLELRFLDQLTFCQEDFIYITEKNINEYEVMQHVSNASTLDYVPVGSITYENGEIVFTPILNEYGIQPVPRGYSEDNYNRINWTMEFEVDLDNDGENEKYELNRNAKLLLIKNEEQEVIATYELAYLFLNEASIVDIIAKDTNNDGKKELYIFGINKLRPNSYMLITLGFFCFDDPNRVTFRAYHLGELWLKKIDHGEYELDWTVQLFKLPLKFKDEDFFFKSETYKILKPYANIPSSYRFDTYEGETVLAIEYGMYIEGYTGRLKSIVTVFLGLGERSFRILYHDFEIISYLGEEAVTEDFAGERTYYSYDVF